LVVEEWVDGGAFEEEMMGEEERRRVVAETVVVVVVVVANFHFAKVVVSCPFCVLSQSTPKPPLRFSSFFFSFFK